MMFRVGLALLEMVQDDLCVLELEDILVFFRKRNSDGSVAAFKFREGVSTSGRFALFAF
jgi:hypothetical protein